MTVELVFWIVIASCIASQVLFWWQHRQARGHNALLSFQLDRYAQQIAAKDRRISELSVRNYDLAAQVRHLEEALGAAQYYCEQADEKIEQLESAPPLVFAQSRGWLIGPFGRN